MSRTQAIHPATMKAAEQDDYEDSVINLDIVEEEIEEEEWNFSYANRFSFWKDRIYTLISFRWICGLSQIAWINIGIYGFIIAEVTCYFWLGKRIIKMFVQFIKNLF